MKSLVRRFVFLVCTVLLTVQCQREQKTLPDLLIENAEIIDNEDLGRNQRNKQVQGFLETNFSEIKNYKPKTWGEARTLFDGLTRILFYIKDERFTSVLEELYFDLERKRFATNKDIKTVREYYIRSRQFEESKKYLQRFPAVKLKGISMPPTLSMESFKKGDQHIINVGGAESLTLEKFALKKYTGLLMVGSPTCEYTKQALGDLNKKYPKNLKKFTLLVPQEDVDLNEIVSWNSANPKLAYKLVYKEQEFSKLSFHRVPYFYFLKNGEVIRKFSGWSGPGAMTRLENNLTKLQENP